MRNVNNDHLSCLIKVILQILSEEKQKVFLLVYVSVLAGTALLWALEQNSMEPASQSPAHPDPFWLHYGS